MPQLNRTSLITDIVTNIFNNITKFITGNNAQQRMVNIVDSTPNILTDANQPNGYVATDANNNILSDFIAENTLYLSVVALAGANQLYGGKQYIINDADGSSRQLLVRVATPNTLYDAAYDIDTGQTGTYVLATDTFTAISGSVASVTGNLVDNTNPANPVVDAAVSTDIGNDLTLGTDGLPFFEETAQVYTKDANENVFFAGVTATLDPDAGRNIFHQGATGNTLGDVKNCCFYQGASGNTLANSANDNVFEKQAINNTVGLNSLGNTFKQFSDSNTLGENCNNNTFESGTGGFVFNDDLRFVTIRQGTSGADYTNMTDYGFIYNNPYPAEIFTDGTDNYHSYYDPTNDRIVVTLMVAPFTVSYIGGSGGGSGTVNSGTANRLAYYATTGTAVSEASAITAAHALKSDANGIPTHFDTATEPSLTELTYVKGVTSAIQTQIDSKLGKDVTIDNKTANYTLALTDANKMIEMTSASNRTIEVPLDATVAFPIGTSILLARNGTGEVTIAGAVGVTLIASANRLRLYNQYSIATLIKRGTDEWYLSGDIKV
jgi:hypothetical protein